MALRPHLLPQDPLGEDWHLTRGEVHVYVGDMDNHYLNLAVYLMEQEVSKLKNPEANFTFEYGRPMKPHGWQPMTNAELVRMMERFRAEHRVQP